jgi:transcriptional regulator with XRE-family HTH domain
MTVDTMQVPKPNPRLPGAEDMAARRVAYERARREWSREDLARRMTDAGTPVNQSAIYKIEHGTPRRTISLDEALAFAEVFELPSVEDLWRPPGEVVTVDLAQFLRDAVDFQSEIRQLLTRMATAFANLAAMSKDAGPLLEYLGASKIEVSTGELQERLARMAALLLEIRDQLAAHPLKLTRGTEGSDQ